MSSSPLASTMQDSQRGGNVSVARKMAFLVRALECDDPWAGASRHSLEAIREVRLERGARAFLRDEAGVLTLRIPDPRVSAKHALLRRDDRGWVFTDEGSRNGSVVDGAPCACTRLVDGAVIEIGSTVLLFRELLIEHDVALDKLVRPSGSPFDTLNLALEQISLRLEQVARSPLSVVLLGETGTGKEVFARALHVSSGRAGPFVAVNCGAIPVALMEAQLFGHVRGAFTNALRDELGFVRSADAGTLFLDEIADLPLSSQAALLRVLQNGEVTPVGSTRAVRTNVRILAATHKDIQALLQTGEFRRDLYARLAGYVCGLPGLRDRPEDIGLLATTLLDRHAGGHDVRFGMDAARALFLYWFPLNVRELEQCLSAALVFAGDGPITSRHFSTELQALARQGRPRSSQPLARPNAVRLSPEETAIRDALVTALRETGGNVTESARRMGKARQQIQRWMRRFELEAVNFRASGG